MSTNSQIKLHPIGTSDLGRRIVFYGANRNRAQFILTEPLQACPNLSSTQSTHLQGVSIYPGSAQTRPSATIGASEASPIPDD